MKLWVFTEYDGVGGSTYRYARSIEGASLYEQELNELGVEYEVNEYNSVADFIESCQEVSGNGFTNREKLEFAIETLREIGV